MVRLHILQVTMRRGLVESLDWMQDSWKIDGGRLTADCVFLATGASPQEPDGFPGIPYIPLDDALVPPRLSGESCRGDVSTKVLTFCYFGILLMGSGEVSTLKAGFSCMHPCQAFRWLLHASRRACCSQCFDC